MYMELCNGSYVILVCRMERYTEGDSLNESDLLPFVASLTHKILHSLTLCYWTEPSLWMLWVQSHSQLLGLCSLHHNHMKSTSETKVHWIKGQETCFLLFVNFPLNPSSLKSFTKDRWTCHARTNKLEFSYDRIVWDL